MKKILSLAMLIACALMLFGCDQLFSPKEPEKVAKVEDFKTYYYVSDRYTVYLHEDKLLVYGIYLRDTKSSLDEFVLTKEMDGPFVNTEFTNAKVKVKDDKYFITADDDLSLEFTIFMDHIIIDSFGTEYIRNKK
ncbi:protein-disulfide isomerase [Lysinibacillus sp. 2017]|uniref:protein-disulfide isomerase n=1 Tax=unclassified Lysinibacillus TaxID=2636778 RepID=UPI000D5257A1|nr:MULTISPECIES: protein-disulfide isomerase [unclassified Lysinibacillus]AWE07477.1 protein-disulfide isomerase [Lysinibacillus sp. 2017]TGN36640.1 protein-disulfide isomerase [Lysinibacillus sp. S2017]